MATIQDLWSGKTSPARSHQTKAKTSKQSSKKSAQSKANFLFLSLKNGQKQEKLWETDFLSHGEHLTRNIGEFPSEESVSTLSQILQVNVPEKYYLSQRACQGILRRASERGKELPEVLKKALERQAGGLTLEVSPTLRAGVVPAALSVENHPTDGRVKIREDDTCQTLCSRAGTGGNNVPLVAEPVTLKIRCGGGNGSRPSHHGDGYKESDVMYTLNTTEQHAVVYAIDRESYNCGQNYARNMGISDDGINSTLDAQGPSAVAAPVYSSSKASFFTSAEKEPANTLVATDYKDPPIVNDENAVPEYIVRRLTPTECARLQGFPDWWCDGLETEEPTEEEIKWWSEVFETHRKIMGTTQKPKSEKQIIKWLKDPHSDSAEYKMWGNGVALPCTYFVLSGIAWAAQRDTQK